MAGSYTRRNAGEAPGAPTDGSGTPVPKPALSRAPTPALAEVPAPTEVPVPAQTPATAQVPAPAPGSAGMFTDVDL